MSDNQGPPRRRYYRAHLTPLLRPCRRLRVAPHGPTRTPIHTKDRVRHDLERDLRPRPRRRQRHAAQDFGLSPFPFKW